MCLITKHSQSHKFFCISALYGFSNTARYTATKKLAKNYAVSGQNVGYRYQHTKSNGHNFTQNRFVYYRGTNSNNIYFYCPLRALWVFPHLKETNQIFQLGIFADTSSIKLWGSRPTFSEP